MQMLYNSDSYVVVQFSVPAEGGALARGGFEIVDKASRKEIFIEGLLAERFEQGARALMESSPGPEELDAYIAGFTGMAQQPLTVH